MTTTTLTALQSGSINSVYVVAIEGFPYLVTNAATTAAAVTAWAASSDFASAIGGLFVELDNRQAFDPWKPLGGGGGTCALRVLPDANDYLGIQLGRTKAGAVTHLTTTISRTATTITVTDTTAFAASGEIYIGNECIAYTGKTGTTFTGCTRGKYSPFPSGEYDTNRWADRHRVVTTSQYGENKVQVTQYRRTWKGAWCGVWEHRVVAGVLDVRAQAHLVFAGQIADVVDDPSTGCAVLQLQHVLDVIKGTTLMRDQFRARIHRGCQIWRNWSFTCSDHDGSAGSPKQANALVVVQSGAAGANQINEGKYTAEELVDKINVWLASEKAAARLYGDHSLRVDGDPQFLMHSHTFGTAGTAAFTAFYMFAHPQVAKFFGETFAGTGGGPLYPWLKSQHYGPSESTDTEPNQIRAVAISDVIGSTLALTDASGVFVDNAGFLPASYATYDDGTNPVGLFLLDGKDLIAGQVSGSNLLNARLVREAAPFSIINPPLAQWVTGVEIVQIAVIAGKRSDLLKWLFCSSGDAAYNEATYDVLAYGLGLNIPGSLLSSTFQASTDTVTAATMDGSIWITKPMKLLDVLESDLIMSGMHLVFASGYLSFAQWRTPLAEHATVTLTEANKASPAGHVNEERSATLLDSSWARPIVKIEFDYDPIADKFAQPLTLEDADAVDSIGGSPVTIHARNFGQGQAAADAMITAIPAFFERWIPFLSRPIVRITRSIDPRFYEGRAPGDIAVLTDAFARDPATGLRGITARPGMILSHRYNPGGASPGSNSITPPQGEVELLVMDTGGTIWSPAAELNETYTTGTYTAGYSDSTKALRCYANVHSEASEAVDASHFAAGDVVLITEVDPTAAPDQWSRTVASVSSNDIILTATLSAPAFSSTKRYRITSAAYTSAQTSQQTDAYQADDVDGLIQGSAPYYFGITGPGISATALAHTVLAELDPTTISAGDGIPYDTGYHVGACKTVNNFTDHKSAQQGPALHTSALSYSAIGTPDWIMVECRKRFFGAGSLGIVRRLLAVAVWLRSRTGAATSVRVTLSPSRPRKNGAQSDDRGDVVWSAPYSQVTFTTSSTTWATSSEYYLDLRYLDSLGCCYIGIEVKDVAETRGLAQCIVRERT